MSTFYDSYHVMKSCHVLECPLLPTNMYSVGIYINTFIKMIADRKSCNKINVYNLLYL